MGQQRDTHTLNMVSRKYSLCLNSMTKHAGAERLSAHSTPPYYTRVYTLGHLCTPGIHPVTPMYTPWYTLCLTTTPPGYTLCLPLSSCHTFATFLHYCHCCHFPALLSLLTLLASLGGEGRLRADSLPQSLGRESGKTLRSQPSLRAWEESGCLKDRA